MEVLRQQQREFKQQGFGREVSGMEETQESDRVMCAAGLLL